jgi:HSP20 family protein
MSDHKSEVTTRRGPVVDIDPLFRDLFDHQQRWSSLLGRPGSEAAGLARWAPAMDLCETSDGYAVTVELPGTKSEDITVECYEHVLTVKGEKRSERDEQDEHRHYSERSFGRFSRSVRVPSDASDDVKAKFNDGVLTIEIPKVEEKKPRTVAIES